MKTHALTRVLFVVAMAAALQLAVAGQAPADLRDRLTARFDVVALQQGIALVPRDAGSSVRLIQVVNGVVSVDGQTLTGAQLRDRLGADADLVLQVSYLDATQQRALASSGTSAGGATAEPQAPAAPPQPETVQRTEVRRGDIIRFGESVTVNRNERVEGDIVVFGDTADINGEVTGDVTVFGERLRLGPEAIVRGDVNAIGGNLARANGAQVLGEVNEVGRGNGRFRGGWYLDNVWSRVLGLGATIFRLTVLLLVSLIVVAFGRNAVESIAARTSATPVRSGLIGLAAEILFLPVTVLTVVVLAVSIVGIPLLILVPFAVLLVMLVALIGFVGLAYQFGGRLTQKFGWTSGGGYGAVAIGILAIGALTLLGRIAGVLGGFFFGGVFTAMGYLVEYVAWTVGFGAALLYWYEMQPGWIGRRRAATATPPPADHGAL